MSALPQSHTDSVQSAGCPLSFSTCGDGIPVLFIQGVGLHGHGWKPQIDSLSKNCRCLFFDNRGIGASQPVGTAPITIPQMAQDALTIMDSHPTGPWQSAHIVGHSLGGLVAQQLALIAPTRVRSLSLLCTFPNGRNATRLSPKMIWIGSRTRIGTRRSRRLAFLQLVFPPEALIGIDRDALANNLAPLFGHDLADSPPIVGPQLAALRACDLTPHLHKLAPIPTLVISAAYDPIAPPPFGRAIAAAIPNAQFLEIPNASHGVVFQYPDQINKLLLNHFLQSESQSPKILA